MLLWPLLCAVAIATSTDLQPTEEEPTWVYVNETHIMYPGCTSASPSGRSKRCAPIIIPFIGGIAFAAGSIFGTKVFGGEEEYNGGRGKRSIFTDAAFYTLPIPSSPMFLAALLSANDTVVPLGNAMLLHILGSLSYFLDLARSGRSIKIPPIKLPALPSIPLPNIPMPMKIGGLIIGNIAVDKLRESIEDLINGPPATQIAPSSHITSTTVTATGLAPSESAMLIQYNHAIIGGAALMGLGLFWLIRQRYMAAIKQSVKDAEALEQGVHHLRGTRGAAAGIRMSDIGHS